MSYKIMIILPKIFRLAAIVLFSIFFFMITSGQKNSYRKSLDHEDCVTDEKKAIEIAESNWLRAFGSSIYIRKPFIAMLKDSSIWIVKGTLNSKKGGVPT